MPQVECFTNPNGLRTVVYEDSSLPYQSTALCVDTIKPTADINSPHFLEHVLCRDEAVFGGKSIGQVVEASSNRDSASTYPEVVRFDLETVPADTHELLSKSLLAMAQPTISPESVEQERQIVASEMVERAASAETGLYERLLHARGYVHTAVQEAAGVPTVTRDQLKHFHDEFFITGNMCLISVGPASASSIDRIVSDTPFTPSPATDMAIGVRRLLPAKERVVVGDESTKTLYFMQMFSVLTDRAVSSVLSRINHSEFNDRFWARAVRDIGVYSASLTRYGYPYDANAMHYLETQGDPKKVLAVAALAREILEQAADRPYAPQVVDHAKREIRNDTISSGGKLLPYSILHEIHSRLPEFPHINFTPNSTAETDAVTPDQIQGLAVQLLEADTSYSLVGKPAVTEKIAKRL